MTFLDALKGVVGADNVLHQGDLSAWEVDWRQRARGKALAVVRPANTDQVAQVVALCAQNRVSLVPQGGNTGMVVGSTPDDSGSQIVLSLTRMQRIREIDRANLTVTVEAGCVLSALQEACAAQGLLFPLSLASEGSCTIGGNLATNAGGTQVLRYGNARELCLGLEVVSAQGDVWNGLSGLRKDNTGYDLRHLFIGSEGTLGVITAATMKLYPMPAATLTALALVPNLQAAVQLLGLAQGRLSAGLSGFEVMGQFALGLVRKHFAQIEIPFGNVASEAQPLSPSTSDASSASSASSASDASNTSFCVLLELDDHSSEEHARGLLEQLLQEAMAESIVRDAIVAQSLAQSRQLWQIRESIPLAQAREGLNIKHDISIPISRIPAFVEETNAAIATEFPGARMVTYGHLGDGNLHYNVQAPANADAEAFLRDQEAPMNALVYAAVDRYHGSISAEHGIGSLKRDTLVKHKSAQALQWMHAIKMALDPLQLMNPGRVLKPFTPPPGP